MSLLFLNLNDPASNAASASFMGTNSTTGKTPPRRLLLKKNLFQGFPYETLWAYDRLQGFRESCYISFVRKDDPLSEPVGRTGVIAPKYRKIFSELKADILSGRYRRGQKMPSEAALMKRTGTSRITVARAFRELEIVGLVERIAGSGTFVRGAAVLDTKAYLFGLLIPELGETEIFAPICRAIASAPAARPHALLWGNAGQASTALRALALMEQFIQRAVDGVFFAPLEFGPDTDKVNRRILRRLKAAGIATVLLDRRISRLSSRDRTDITGLHHRHATYIAAEHLIETDCRKLCLVTAGCASSSVADRQAGFEQAIADYGVKSAKEFDLETSSTELRRWVRSSRAPGVVCINDRIAGRVLHLASKWKLKVPDELRVTGIDDLGYASTLPISLTTVRQPVEQIGETALQLMLERIHSPNRPTREVLLDGFLMVRESSGGSFALGGLKRAEINV